MNLSFKLMIKHKIKTLEEETMLGLYDIILRMHKHAVNDYINVINYYCDDDDEEMNEDDDKAKNECEIDEIFRKIFFEMFEHIESDLQYRVKNLKSKLMKRFEIKSDVEKLLSKSESESESESESQIDNELMKPMMEKI